VAVEGLPNPKDKDLDFLRASGRRNYARLTLKVFAVFLALVGLGFLVLYSVHLYRGTEDDLAAVHRQLLSLNSPWAEEFSISLESQQEWLENHGTYTEARVFSDISSVVARSAIAVASESDGEMPFLTAMFVSFHTGAVRVLFVVIASLRLWLVAIMFAVCFGINRFKAYEGNDVLGQMGNGRLFYSGVRADLDRSSPEGAPDVQVRGLACPQLASSGEARASDLWRVLTEFGAANATNETLSAIILKNGETASYVSYPEEDQLLRKAFDGDLLRENSQHLLSSVLALHALYSAGEIRASPPAPANSSTPASSFEYAEKVRHSMHRVLTTEMRQILGAVPAAEVATMLLSLEAGKVLAHSFEGGRWIKRSNFPQLSARAVLHSVAGYPVDYDYAARQRIRRALIYGSRRSSFAPVRMPIDLTEDIWALRQWSEILLANPHELDAVSDEVELVGLVRYAHRKWSREFLDSAGLISAEIARSSYATPANLLFLPLSHVLASLRTALDPAEIRRIEALGALVSSRQRLNELARDAGDEYALEHPSFERVFAPISDDDLATFVRLHEIDPNDVKDWSALRIVLSSYGWLARRVGDYTVPESSLIFAVFQSDGSLEGTNSLGLLGKAGMVPFRGSKLQERWGKNWANRFTYVGGATMAETTEDYEKLLRGIKETLPDDPISAQAPSVA
jgi:hypothetical protein